MLFHASCAKKFLERVNEELVMMGLLCWEMIVRVVIYIYMYTRIMGLGFLDTMFTTRLQVGIFLSALGP